jgi:hypothetical protein
MASNTGWMSVRELAMTRRIAPTACSRSSASASRFSASSSRFWSRRLLESSFFSDLRAPGSLASTFAFAGLAPRRIGLSSPLTGVTTQFWLDQAAVKTGGRA